MLNKISTSLIVSLCLQSSIVTVKAMEVYPVKPEPDFSMQVERKAPLSIDYITQRMGMINPAYDEGTNTRTRNCLACAKAGYEWLSQQLDYPQIAEDHVPTAPNIWLKNTARLLSENTSSISHDEFERIQGDDLDGDLFIFSNPLDKNLIVIPDDDFKEAQFSRVKLKNNQHKAVKRLEDYIKGRFYDPKIEENQFLTGILYLDVVGANDNSYPGHFVNFYTLFIDSKFETIICDFQRGMRMFLPDFIAKYCGPLSSLPLPVYKNEIYVWSGETHRDILNPKTEYTVENSKTSHYKRPRDEANLGLKDIFKKGRIENNSNTGVTTNNTSPYSSTEEELSLDGNLVNQNSWNNSSTVSFDIVSSSSINNNSPISTREFAQETQVLTPKITLSINNQNNTHGYGQIQPFSMPFATQAIVGGVGSLSMIECNLALDLAKSENEYARDVAAGVVFAGMQNNIPWVVDKLNELTKSINGPERQTAARVISAGMQNNAHWAEEKLVALAKSKNATERSSAGQAIFYGMQTNARWAEEKLAALAKGENGNERNSAGQAIFYGMQINAHWAEEKLVALAKSENVLEQASAGLAIFNGIQNKVPWASEKLAALAKSKNTTEQDTAGLAIDYGMQKSAHWAEEKLVALAKSENWYEEQTALRACYVGMQNNTHAIGQIQPSFSPPLTLSQNTTRNNQTNTAGYGPTQSYPLSSTISPLVGQMENASRNNQPDPQFVQGSMVPYSVFVMQQTEIARQQKELVAAYQEIQRLRGEVMTFQTLTKPKGS